MTTPTERPGSGDAADGGELPDTLRWQLRALRGDEAPARDLWPAIAARLETPAAGRAQPRPRWYPTIALAATLLLALGVGGLWRGGELPDGSGRTATSDVASPTIVQREAEGLARQYDAALHELALAPHSPGLQPTLVELDRSLALIHDALARDPDSRLLLDQLRRTYAHRLALAQRAVYS